MIFTSVHNLLLSVHTPGEPRPNEWRRYLAAIERRHSELCGILMLQLSGWPSFRLLYHLRRGLLGKRKVRVALITSSNLQRIALTGLGWLADWDVAAFTLRDLRAGLDFVIQGDGAMLGDDVERTFQDLTAGLRVRG